RSEEHTSELQSLAYLVCRLLLENKSSFLCRIGAVAPPSPEPRAAALSLALSCRAQSHSAYWMERVPRPPLWACRFFFNDTATTEIYTLSLHDALPIFAARFGRQPPGLPAWFMDLDMDRDG